MTTRDKSCYIEKELRKEIASGKYKTGEALPTETELSEEYGVSRMTLRKALKKLKDAGLLDSSRGAGNFVKAKQRNNIALIAVARNLYSEQAFFFLKMLETAQNLAEKEGLTSTVHIRTDSTTQSLADLIGSEVLESSCGIISMAAGTRKTAEELCTLSIPAVTHSIIVPILDKCVVLDYGTLLDKAMDILKERNIQDFACMHWEFPPPHLKPGCMHYELDRLLKSKIRKAQMLPVPYSNDAAASYEIFKKLMTSRNHPRHIFFTDDAFCAHACLAIKEMGIRVPDDLAILTHGNKGRRFDNPVPMTIIGFDPEEIMTEEWEILKSSIRSTDSTSKQIKTVAPRIWDNTGMTGPQKEASLLISSGIEA